MDPDDQILECPECALQMEISSAIVYQDENGEMQSAFMLNQIATRCNNARCPGYLKVYLWNRHDRDFVPVAVLQAEEAQVPQVTPLDAKLILRVFGKAIGRGLLRRAS